MFFKDFCVMSIPIQEFEEVQGKPNPFLFVKA